MNTAASTIREATGALSDAANRASDYASDNIVAPARRAAGRAAEAIEEGVDSVLSASRRQAVTASAWIADNPLKAVGISAGAGLLIGLFARRC